MISAEFRAVAAVLSKYIPDTYTMLGVADEVMSALNMALMPDYSTHDGRVQAALNNALVIDFLVDSKKINAIKELRAATSCGLKEAKDAVEDRRVVEAAAQAKQERDLQALRDKLSGPEPDTEQYEPYYRDEDYCCEDCNPVFPDPDWSDRRDPDEPPF